MFVYIQVVPFKTFLIQFRQSKSVHMNMLSFPLREGGGGHFHMGLHRTCRLSGYHFSMKIPEPGYKIATDPKPSTMFDDFLKFGKILEKPSRTSVFSYFLSNS